MIRKCWLLCVCLTLSACAAPVAAPTPALLPPISEKADTAVVTRGNVEKIDQHRAFVRVRSEGLHFNDTGLRFGEYFVAEGDRVVAGQLLARLDTEDVEEQIADEEKKLDTLRMEQYFEAEALALDIDIARAEYVNAVRLMGFDETAMAAAEEKKLAVARAELDHAQTLERQALAYRHAAVYADELKEKLREAELRAPYDGLVTFRAPKMPGAYVEAYADLVYLSDETFYMLEYAGDNDFSLGRGQTAKAAYGDKVYDMERLPLSRQEALFYTSLMRVPPLRLVPADPAETLPPPGTFLTLYVYTGVAEDTLYVPVNALFSDTEQGRYVHRVENGAKVSVPVTVGLLTDAYAEITEGVAEGDVVFVKP